MTDTIELPLPAAGEAMSLPAVATVSDAERRGVDVEFDVVWDGTKSRCYGRYLSDWLRHESAVDAQRRDQLTLKELPYDERVRLATYAQEFGVPAACAQFNVAEFTARAAVRGYGG